MVQTGHHLNDLLESTVDMASYNLCDVHILVVIANTTTTMTILESYNRPDLYC